MILNTAQTIKYFPEFIELNLDQSQLDQFENKKSLNSYVLNQVQGRFALIPNIKDIPTLLYIYEILKENVRGIAVKDIKNIEIFNNDLEDIIIPENHNLDLIDFYDQLVSTSINFESSELVDTLNLNLSEIWGNQNQDEDIIQSIKKIISENSHMLKKAKVLNLTGEAPAVFVFFLMRIISYQVSEIFYQLDNSKERLKIK